MKYQNLSLQEQKELFDKELDQLEEQLNKHYIKNCKYTNPMMYAIGQQKGEYVGLSGTLVRKSSLDATEETEEVSEEPQTPSHKPSVQSLAEEESMASQE